MNTFYGNLYSFTTVDNETHKRLLCGRTQDVEAIFNYLERYKSIALIGERRIGKTLFLLVLRDIINYIASSRPPYQLLDTKLGDKWDELGHKLVHCQAVYVDLQNIPYLENEQVSEFLQVLIQKKCRDVNIYVQPKSSLIMFFEKLTEQLKNHDKRLIILMDEVEGLEKFKDVEDVFDNFRGVISSHSDKLSFIFSGAVKHPASVIIAIMISIFIFSLSGFR